MTPRSACLITAEACWDGKRISDSTRAALRRFHLREVAIAVLTTSAEQTQALGAALAADAALITGWWSPAHEREYFPRPHLVLRCLREGGFAAASSWLIATTTLAAQAAGQAGCAGCVMVGGAVPTGEDLGLVVAQADDLADAPRVMIPRGGGCWHDPPKA